MANRQVSVTVSAKDQFSGTLSSYVSKMRDANRITDGVKGAAGFASSAFNLLGGAVTGAVAGMAIGQVLQFGQEIVEIGSAAQLSADRFDTLAGGAANAADLMNELRSVTKGTVDDMTLMGGANELMRTGIAENAEEVSGLLEMALALRKPTMSAQEAIDDFTAMLLNSSIPRLDSFGISSANVRQRITELVETGQAANRDEAFAMAVMEEGATSMERLGEATGIADSAVMRLGTRLTNMKTTFAEWGNAAIEAGAAVAEDMLAPIDERLERAATQSENFEAIRDIARFSAQSYIEELGNAIDSDAVVRQMMADPEIARSIISAGIHDAEQGMGLDAVEGMRMALIDPNQFNTEELEAWVQLYEEARDLSNERADARERERAAAEATAGVDQIMLVRQERHLQAQRESYAAVYDMTDLYMQNTDLLGDINEREREANMLSRERVSVASDLNMLYNEGIIMVGQSRFMNDENAAAVRSAADEMERMVEEADRMGLDTEAFKEAARDARELANEAERANQAFRTMGMAEAFGATGDPNANFLRDILGQAGIEGQAADLATGDTSRAQIYYDENINPVLMAINEQVGAEAAVEAAERFSSRYVELVAQGMNFEHAARIAGEELGYEMAEGAGEEFTVRMGDTVTGLSASTGMSQEEIMAQLQQQYGVTDPRFIQAGMTFGGGGELVYTGAAGYGGFGNIPEDAGVMAESNKGFDLGISEEDVAMSGEVAANLQEIGEMTAPDFSPETIGLDTSLDTIVEMIEEMKSLTEKKHVIEVEYAVRVTGDRLPAGGEVLTASSEVRGR